ncbi:hypothetical protein ACFS07_26815 [Undibacterium arcticum]
MLLVINRLDEQSLSALGQFWNASNRSRFPFLQLTVIARETALWQDRMPAGCDLIDDRLGSLFNALNEYREAMILVRPDGFLRVVVEILVLRRHRPLFLQIAISMHRAPYPLCPRRKRNYCMQPKPRAAFFDIDNTLLNLKSMFSFQEYFFMPTRRNSGAAGATLMPTSSNCCTAIRNGMTGWR